MSAACRTGYEKRPSLSFVLASSSRASVSSDRLSLDCVFVFLRGVLVSFSLSFLRRGSHDDVVDFGGGGVSVCVCLFVVDGGSTTTTWPKGKQAYVPSTVSCGTSSPYSPYSSEST